jgi:hypothetical protein
MRSISGSMALSSEPETVCTCYELFLSERSLELTFLKGISRLSLAKVFKKLNHSIVSALKRADSESGSGTTLEPSELWKISEKVRNCALMAMIELCHRIQSGALISPGNFHVYESDQLQASNITLPLETSSIIDSRVEVPVIYTTGTARSFRERSGGGMYFISAGFLLEMLLTFLNRFKRVGAPTKTIPSSTRTKS